MKATIRIVTPAAATAAAALLLTACAEKPVRIPGGAFVEEPYQGETVTRTQTQTIPSNGTDTLEVETIYIETDLPVGPVENDTRQDDLAGLQGGDQLQPIEQEPETKSSVPEGSVEYKVVKGDTLWGIGMVYGVSVDRLAEVNGISKNSTLKIGQVLMIPPDAKNAVGKPIPQKKTDSAKSDAASSAKPASTTKPASTSTKPASSATTPATKDGETLYVVKSGDNLSTIAYRHHVKLADLVAANKVDPKAILRVGQTLVIPAAGTKAASAATSTTKSTNSASTGTKPASTTSTTKAGSTTATTTSSATATTTKPAETSQQRAGEGTGGVVEPLSGSSFGGSASSASTTKPATTTTTPASSGSSAGLAPVSAVPDAGVLPIITDFDATIEELADYHDRSLVDMMRLNPQYRSGQRIPRGTMINLPLY